MSGPFNRRHTVLGGELSSTNDSNKRQRVATMMEGGLVTQALSSGTLGAARARRLSSLVAEPQVQIQQLEDAVAELKRAKREQSTADASRARALRKLQQALPAAEEMVQGAAAVLSANDEAALPSRALRAEQADAQALCTALAGKVRHAADTLAGHPRSGTSQPAVRGTLLAATDFCAVVRQVGGHIEQLHAQRAARSSHHNDSRALAIRVLGIDQVRAVVIDSLSLRNLFALRRTCRDFQRWSVTEVACLPPLALEQEAFEICPLTFTAGHPEYRISMEIKVPQHNFPMGDNGTAMVDGPGYSSLYLAGGGDRYESSSMQSSASVWRPDPSGETEGEWHALDPLPTGISGATGCVVTMADGEQVLALVGGTHKIIDNRDDDDSDDDDHTAVKVIVLRSGGWETLTAVPVASPCYRHAYRTVALPNGRLAVVGLGTTRREVHVLDIEAESWRRLPDLTVARMYPLLVVRGHTIFVLGGLNLFSAPLFSCEKLTLKDDDEGEGGWRQCIAMPTGAPPPDEYEHKRSRAFLVRDSLLVTCLQEEGNTIVLLRLYDFGTRRWYSTKIQRNYDACA